MDDSKIAVRIRVAGLVQGVSYRFFAANEARRLGLYGWIRNRVDGTVEAVVSGDKANVDAFVAACRRGPPDARVDRLEVEPAGEPGETGFRQLPTA